MRVGLAVLAAAVIGFLLAMVLFGGDHDGSTNASATETTTTTTTGQPGTTAPATTASTTLTTPQQHGVSVQECIQLWNQANNRGAQVFLANIASQQPIRVHVGESSANPPECLVTVIANNGDAFTFPEGGGTTYPYAPAPGRTTGKDLPEAQRTQNALEQADGTLKPS
jgi:hypothetical protein